MLALFPLTMVSCTSHPRPGLGQGVAHGWNSVIGGHTSTIETFTIPLEGMVSVEVDAFAGDVVIKADDRLKEATIEVIRRGEHGYGRKGESEESLNSIALAHSIAEHSSGRSLVVKATTTASEPWYQRADITITLPRLGAAIVRTTRGHVFVTDCREGVDIETTKGDVRLVTAFALSQSSTILDAEGTIDWRSASDTSARFEAETVNGSVQMRASGGVWRTTDRRNDHDSLYGTVNAGMGLIVLRTVDGDIRVYVGPHPTQSGSFVH